MTHQETKKSGRGLIELETALETILAQVEPIEEAEQLTLSEALGAGHRDRHAVRAGRAAIGQFGNGWLCGAQHAAWHGRPD